MLILPDFDHVRELIENLIDLVFVINYVKNKNHTDLNVLRASKHKDQKFSLLCIESHKMCKS